MNTHVLVFKTSVHHPMHVHRLKPTLNLLIRESGNWHFDLEDQDRILRIENARKTASSIITHLRLHGFFCEELPD